jgi:hypothetical protein
MWFLGRLNYQLIVFNSPNDMMLNYEAGNIDIRSQLLMSDENNNIPLISKCHEMILLLSVL